MIGNESPILVIQLPSNFFRSQEEGEEHTSKPKPPYMFFLGNPARMVGRHGSKTSTSPKTAGSVFILTTGLANLGFSM